MSEYTPEKGDELIAEARRPWCKDCDHFINALANALEEAIKDRDAARQQYELHGEPSAL